MLFALIPAAGHSTRMGRPKLALPLGERCVLEWVIRALRQAGVDEVLAVLGPHVADLVKPAERAGASVLLLPDATPDMRATVEQGLTWLERTHKPDAEDGWLLVPGDHPVLNAAAVRGVLSAYEKQTGCSIALPTFAGRRGHPAVLAWKHVAGIRALPPGVGLNGYIRQHAAETLEVPVDNDSVLLDLDTPADYAGLCQRFSVPPHADG